jgi:hypothetical protein
MTYDVPRPAAFEELGSVQCTEPGIEVLIIILVSNKYPTRSGHGKADTQNLRQ